MPTFNTPELLDFVVLLVPPPQAARPAAAVAASRPARASARERLVRMASPMIGRRVGGDVRHRGRAGLRPGWSYVVLRSGGGRYGCGGRYEYGLAADGCAGAPDDQPGHDDLRFVGQRHPVEVR